MALYFSHIFSIPLHAEQTEKSVFACMASETNLKMSLLFIWPIWRVSHEVTLGIKCLVVIRASYRDNESNDVQ